MWLRSERNIVAYGHERLDRVGLGWLPILPGRLLGKIRAAGLRSS